MNVVDNIYAIELTCEYLDSTVMERLMFDDYSSAEQFLIEDKYQKQVVNNREVYYKRDAYWMYANILELDVMKK